MFTYTVWPADKLGIPAAMTTSNTWHQKHNWLVLDVTEGLAAAFVVEGPVTRQIADHRALELSATARWPPTDPRNTLLAADKLTTGAMIQAAHGTLIYAGPPV